MKQDYKRFTAEIYVDLQEYDAPRVLAQVAKVEEDIAKEIENIASHYSISREDASDIFYFRTTIHWSESLEQQCVDTVKSQDFERP